MKKLIKSIAIAALVFTAFSCSKEEQKSFQKVSIAKLATVTPELSIFKEALDVTGLTATFEDAGNYTVFVPTNTAFASVLGGMTVTDFNTANPGVLAKVLKYHVIANAGVLSKDLTNNQSVATLQGQNITINLIPNTYYPAIDPDLNTYEQTSIFVKDAMNNSSRVFARDVLATNGVIHIIDAVLMPSNN
ncbi:fasciclin domain-containing protein [Flavobacterium sp.]|uniref:fasciclin domain-containing protein n=1 Tax=Flavobacterium sp. TaxID=239 RepID=UPI0025E45CAE|nr:fasciclin domain-containing protein [Flavobacterium sp.]